jgi:hypothetical protein
MSGQSIDKLRRRVKQLHLQCFNIAHGVLVLGDEAYIYEEDLSMMLSKRFLSKLLICCHPIEKETTVMGGSVEVNQQCGYCP